MDGRDGHVAVELEPLTVQTLDGLLRAVREGTAAMAGEVDPDAGYGVIRVVDDGSGIAADKLPRVFDPHLSRPMEIDETMVRVSPLMA